LKNTRRNDKWQDPHCVILQARYRSALGWQRSWLFSKSPGGM